MPMKVLAKIEVCLCVCGGGGGSILDVLVIVLSVQHFIGESVSQLPW